MEGRRREGRKKKGKVDELTTRRTSSIKVEFSGKQENIKFAPPLTFCRLCSILSPWTRRHTWAAVSKRPISDELIMLASRRVKTRRVSLLGNIIDQARAVKSAAVSAQ